VNVSLLFSVLSCWLAWTILVAELPFEGAKGGVFPKFLARENSYHAPAPSLWLSSMVMQITLFVILFAHNAWIWLISITGVMILPPYLASTAYLVLYARRPEFKVTRNETRGMSKWTGILAGIYALWLIYAAGPQFLLMSTIIFALGLPVYWYARRERSPSKPAFSGRELVAGGSLTVLAVIALVLFVKGIVQIG
jgi:arginine:ornithine antiporter/lysine permease